MSSLETSFDLGPAFSWASIGLAVLTAILQGMVAAMTFVTESSGQWTFRFRLARAEHYWWTFVAGMLLISLIMSAIAFLGGRGGDPVSVLALSSATFLAIIQYALPAWQQRRFTNTRWYAWTGDSRTAVKKEYASLCQDAMFWQQLASKTASARSHLQQSASDVYGWRLWRVTGIEPDPTDILLLCTDAIVRSMATNEKAGCMVGVYQPLDDAGETFSLLWGQQQCFRPRVSRAILSMPYTLLTPRPTTMDGYNGRGLALAMGILGRNKGLQPWTLLFKSNSSSTRLMESTSTWSPRPAKVLRSFYQSAMRSQYGGLGEDFVDAATELALLLVDIPNRVIDQWLRGRLEHQSLAANNLIADTLTGETRKLVLAAQYEASYTSMVLSLNYMHAAMKDQTQSPAQPLGRPDLLCTALLCQHRALGPSIWQHQNFREAIRKEAAAVASLSSFQTVASGLLGLKEWPSTMDHLLDLTQGQLMNRSPLTDYFR